MLAFRRRQTIDEASRIQRLKRHGAARVTASGATIRAALADLDAQFPGIAVAVDGVVAPDGLRRRLTTPRDIHFAPALARG